MHSAAPFKRGKKPLIKPKRACTFCARPLKILHSKIPCLPAAQRTVTRRIFRQDESQRELILIQLDLTENVPDVALTGILRLVKKIMVKRRPIQIVFRSAGVYCTAKPSYIHLQIQVKRMIEVKSIKCVKCTSACVIAVSSCNSR